MTCVTLELKSQEKKEIEYEQQKKSLMEDIHFNIIFKRIYIRRWLRDRKFDEEEIRRRASLDRRERNAGSGCDRIH